MYQKEITNREEGQRLDKYLHKLLPEAGSSFLYKMLRKKNIVLNDKKANGSEKIEKGDVITLYFAEETLAKFMGKTAQIKQYETAYRKYEHLSILYENEHILLVDKPAGLLTQKAAPQDISLNEWLIGYLLSKQKITEAELQTFKPSVCNRLDRNTSGIVLCAKTIQGAQMLGEILKDRSLHKYYRLYVKGSIEKEQVIEGYLWKDEKRNKVEIRKKTEILKETTEKETGDYIKTRYYPISKEADKTLLEVELITGKTHQIRAHLASIGCPLLGDYKYGDKAWNDSYQKSCQVKHQLLHAYRVVFPKLEAPFLDISEKTFESPMPDIFEKVKIRQIQR